MVKPLVHEREGISSNIQRVLIGHQLHGELVRAVVGDGDGEPRPERNDSFGDLLLPPLLDVLVVVQGRPLGIPVPLENKEIHLPFLGGFVGWVLTHLQDALREDVCGM